MKNLLALAIIVLGFSAASFGIDTPTTKSANASANIIVPIILTKNVDLVFGNVAVQGAGTVAMAASAAGTRTNSTNITLPVLTGSPSAAKFSVTGEGASTYDVSLPSSTTITAGVGETMTVDTFVSNLPSDRGTISGSAGTSGTGSFYVGATLNIDAAQPVGLYSGSFEVTVNYN
jgi:hypothetical protein